MYKVNSPVSSKQMPPLNEIGEETVRAIAPYIPILLNNLGEGAVKKAGAEAFDTAKTLYNRLWTKAKNDEATKAALEQAAGEPESEAYKQALQKKVIALLEKEDVLAQSLADILAATELLTSQRGISVGRNVIKSQFLTDDYNQLTINNTVNEVALKPVRTGEISNVPSCSKTFEGRDEALSELNKRLSSGNAVAIIAIHGMGGVGKTELALQCAKRYAAYYPGGRCYFQVRELDVASDIVAFARRLHIAPPQDMELLDKVAYCWDNWPGSERVLVIYDDVTDYARVEAVLPPESGRFVVLMTTRQHHLAVTVEPFKIEVLSEGAALELLRRIVGESRTEAELETAKAICEWVGYLPLGLELVGHYLNQKPEVTYEKLRGRLETQRTEARALQKTYPGMTGKLGVIEAFELSWKALSEDAQQVACWLSLFALAPIPLELAESGVEEARREDAEDGRDELISRNLLRRVEIGNYQLHQLVREYFLAKLAQRENSSAVRQAYCRVTVALAQHLLSSPTHEMLLRLAPVIPHIAEATTSWQKWLSDENNELIVAFNAIALFYEEKGDYGRAEPWCVKCLNATQNRFGEDHPDVASSLSMLAELYRRQGRYTEAEPLCVKALKLRRSLFSENHPDVATSLNNLALLYHKQGQYEEAEPLYVEALELRRNLLGEQHLDVATSLNNLAGLYQNQGRYEEAKLLCVKALELRQYLLGQKHLDTTNSMNSLAHIYQAQGRYKRAEPFFVKALAVRRDLLGEEHPDVAVSINNLALFYLIRGRYEEAEPLVLQGLEINRKILGKDHPDVASNLNNLAGLYKNQRRYEKAEPFYLQGLELNRKVLGEEHPTVATNLNNLAELYYSQGRYEEAEPLHIRALDLRCKLLGENHHYVATSLNNLAGLYYSQERYEEAEPLYVQAIAILHNSLGQNHPNTNTVINNFAQFVAAVLAAERQIELSDHPFTQQIIEFIQSQPAPD